MKYMILTYASQQDYDGMAGQATELPAWSPEDFAAMAATLGSFNTELAEGWRARRDPPSRRRCTPDVSALRTACRSSPTVRTPRPRRCSPVTGSWNAPASTGRPRSPAGSRGAQHRNRPRQRVRGYTADHGVGRRNQLLIFKSGVRD